MKRVVEPAELDRVEISEWPRITVVTPTYNRPEYLEETILSVLNQNYPNLEYIIVDGGSTDRRVFEIIRKYENRLAWWISEPDGGHAEAIKKGFDRSTGEILAWLCSDDTYLPGALRSVGEVFRQQPKVDVVYGHARLINEHGDVVRELRAVPYNRLALFAACSIHQASVFWRRALYERVGGVSLAYNRYATDHELFYRFANANAKWYFLRQTLSTFRRHSHQTTFQESREVHEYWWKAAREHFPFWTQGWVYPLLHSAMMLRHVIWLVLQGDGRLFLKKRFV